MEQKNNCKLSKVGIFAVNYLFATNKCYYVNFKTLLTI